MTANEAPPVPRKAIDELWRNPITVLYLTRRNRASVSPIACPDASCIGVNNDVRATASTDWQRAKTPWKCGRRLKQGTENIGDILYRAGRQSESSALGRRC